MSEHKYNDAYSKGYKNGQKDQCLADTVDDAMYTLSKLGNVTNGDMIKALFPNAYFEEYEDECRHIVIMWTDGKSSIIRSDFEWDWWNTQYKKEVEE